MRVTPMEGLLALAEMPAAVIPRSARTIADLSVFDFFVVAIAGAAEPACRMVRDLVLDEGGRSAASLIGVDRRVPPRAAALANGVAAHALDYDDTHFAHVGHPSVAVLPAALALAEDRDLSAAALRDAFLIGAEASIRLGMALGRRHYDLGFHQTATAGCFGATVAAGRLLGLEPRRMRMALSLASTRSSGLKSQFGSMGKPFNAGMAAANGVEAALLAARGFVSCDDGIGGAQGFLVTHAAVESAWPTAEGLLFEDVKHKFHACCHGTHAMIEALRQAQADQHIDASDVAEIALAVNPRWLSVCDIKAPRSGLEIKFSYAFLAAMVVSGDDTAADRTYTAALAADPLRQALASRVTVAGDAAQPDTATAVVIRLRDGRQIHGAHDIAGRMPSDRIAAGLRRKAEALIGPARADAIRSAIADLESLSARDLGALLRR